MPRKSRRQEIEAEARKAHRAAGQKVSRLERKGVRVRKEGLDPRVSAEAMARMSTRELAAYRNRLQKFTSRETSFVPGMGGIPLPRSKWQEYLHEQAIHNAKAAAREAQVGDIVLPGQDQTVAERLNSLNQSARTGATNRIVQKINRPAKGIRGPEELEKLIKQVRKKNARGYETRTVKKRMNSVIAILKNSGNEAFIPIVKKLSPDAQIMLIDYSTFLSIAKDRFYPQRESVQRRDRDYELRYGVHKEDDIHDALHRVINWAVENSGDVRSASTTKGIARGNASRALRGRGPQKAIES